MVPEFNVHVYFKFKAPGFTSNKAIRIWEFRLVRKDGKLVWLLGNLLFHQSDLPKKNTVVFNTKFSKIFKDKTNFKTTARDFCHTETKNFPLGSVGETTIDFDKRQLEYIYKHGPTSYFTVD